MRTRAFLALILGALALTAILSACGGTGSGAKQAVKALDPVAAAAERTVGARTMHMSGSATMQMPGVARPMTFTMEGDTDLANGRMSMRMDMSQMASAFGSMGGSVLGDSADWNIEMVAETKDAFVMYMRAPFLTAIPQVGDKWIKLDMQNLGEQMGFDFSSMMGGADQWSQSVDWLRGSKNTWKVGPETIRGAATTHYRTIIDFDQVAEMVPEDRREAIEKSIEALEEQTNAEYSPFDVWVDAQGRIRREKFSFSADSEGQRSEMTMDIEFYDFNLPVTIATPPAAQTVDVMELAGGALE